MSISNVDKASLLDAHAARVELVAHPDIGQDRRGGERRHSTAVLRDRESLTATVEIRLQDIIDSIFGFVAVFSADGTLIHLNHRPANAAETLPDEVLGKLFWETFWWDGVPDAERRVREALELAAQGQASRFDAQVRDCRHQPLDMDLQVTPLYDGSGRITHLLGFGVDVTERKRAQAQLQELNERLEQRVSERSVELLLTNQALQTEIEERRLAESAALELASRLKDLTHRFIDVQETVKRRLAREIHDRVSSNLSAIGFNLNLVAKQLPPESATLVAGRLADTLGLVQDSLVSAREISGDLRPAALDYGGLLPALQDYAQQFQRRTGLAVEVTEDQPVARLPAGSETGLFRIVQEALTNCAKHAQAQKIQVSLRTDAEHFLLCIADDGAGFDISSLWDGEKSPGMGLLSMRERAEAIGARLNIESAPGAGTRITIAA